MTKQQEPQKFLGPIIAATIVEKVVGAVLERLAKSKDVSLTKKDVPVVREAVTQEVTKEYNSRIEHATNNEPAIKSRVVQGSAGTIILAITGVVQMWFDGIPNTPADYMPHVGVIATALWAIYGRLRARKPVGE